MIHLLNQEKVEPTLGEVETPFRQASGELSGSDTNSASSPAVPPLQYYGAAPSWRLVNGRELWRHRELLWMLALRDLKVRYRQTIVGIGWVVLSPLAMGSIFVLFFGLLGRMPAPEGVPYALIVLTGLLPWQLFAGTVTSCTTSLVANQHLIGKVYFPRLVLPMATAIPNLVDFAFALLLPVALMIYYRVSPSWPILLLPVFIVLVVSAALAIGIWLSALNAIYRDVGYLVPFLLQLGFFLSPVVYATNALIPKRWQSFVALNPMVGALEGIRWSLFGAEKSPLVLVLTSASVTTLILVTGLLYFRRVEGVLADRI
ncbi:MAG TPA: ABC transporter permease [Gemmataceae bacterium]|nr:ABC transporter permease [Gemmataceae bacterium]